MYKSMTLKRITKTEVEDKEGESEQYSSSLENKDKGIRITISQPEKFIAINVGSKYDITLKNPQKTLKESVKKDEK